MFFGMIHFLLPDLPPLTINDTLAAMSYEHALSVHMRVMERYNCGLHY